MLQANVNQNNQANIIGRIVTEFTFSHEVYGEGFYSMGVEVPRLSDVSDVLPVTISDRLVDKDALQIGDLVEINGQLRSYNNFSDKKNKLVLTIFARELIALNEETKKNPNQIILNGFVCKPPVYRTTPFGREIADILVAINRSYNKSDYIPCISWGRNAKFAGRLGVGDNIKLWGRMQSRMYQKKLEDGSVSERTALEVSISKLEQVTGKPAEELEE